MTRLYKSFRLKGMITAVVVSAVAAVMREFETAWRRERHAVGLVQLERDRLELRVADRTKELQEKNTRLEAALDDVQTLKGLLPICAQCRKIRDDEGHWQEAAVFMQQKAKISFSHGMCPDGTRALYPDVWEKLFGDDQN